MNPNPINPIYTYCYTCLGGDITPHNIPCLWKKYQTTLLVQFFSYTHTQTPWYCFFSFVFSRYFWWFNYRIHSLDWGERLPQKKTGVPHSCLPPNTKHIQNTLQHSNTLFILNCFSSHLNSLIFNVVSFTQVINMAEATKQKKKNHGNILVRICLNFSSFVEMWNGSF